MDKKFKWNMFITSFIPLWLSIIVADIWSIIENGIQIWPCEKSLVYNLNVIFQKNTVSIVVVLITTVLMVISVISINRFLKDKCSNNAPPKIKIKKALRANKLSSEFLLAYILPMIAFDFTALKSVVLFVIYFAMLAFLCIRNNNVYTNVWLALVLGCGAADRFFGDIQTRQLRAQMLRHPDGIVSLAAAHIQNGAAVPDRSSLHRFDNGRIAMRFQKGPAGQHLLPGVAGVQRPLLLHRQQIHIPLPGHIKAVPPPAAAAFPLPFQTQTADGADQFHIPFPPVRISFL